MADDLGYADVGFTNPDCPIPTPNLDRLANAGVKLKNYYVHPTCSPSRAALMTGRYAVNVGLAMPILPGTPGGLEPEYRTLPEYLNETTDGLYKNYLVGKWNLGYAKSKYLPLNRGFHKVSMILNLLSLVSRVF